MESGYIYLIENQNGLVKIGKALRPEQRFAVIESQGGFAAVNKYISQELIGYGYIESAMHEKFKTDRAMGEWFHTSFDTLKATLSDEKWIKEILANVVFDIGKKLKAGSIANHNGSKISKKPRLFQRIETGIWYVEIKRGCKRSLKTRDGDEAQKRYNLIVDNLQRNIDVTLSKAVEMYLEDKPKLAKKTIHSYRNIIGSLISIVGDKCIDDITKIDLERFYVWCSTAGLKRESINTHRRTINMLIDYAHDEKLTTNGLRF